MSKCRKINLKQFKVKIIKMRKGKSRRWKKKGQKRKQNLYLLVKNKTNWRAN